MASDTARKTPKRKPRTLRTLTPRQKKLFQGVMAGKNPHQAALQAGYSPATAKCYPYQFLSQPFVKTPLTEALERSGVGFDEIVKPIKEGLEAKMRVTFEGSIHESADLADHRMRKEYVELAASLMGGIPKNIQAPEAQRLPLMVVIAKDTGNGNGGPPPPKDITPSNGTPAQPGKPLAVTFQREGAKR